MDHAEDGNNPPPQGSTNGGPYYDTLQQQQQQQQHSFREQIGLAGLLPAHHHQRQSLEQQYYASAYGQQQLMAHQLLTQLGQQQQAPLLQNHHPQYSDVSGVLHTFSAGAQYSEHLSGNAEGSSSPNHFDEEDDELNALNKGQSEAAVDGDDNDEMDDDSDPAEEKEGYFTPDDTNQEGDSDADGKETGVQNDEAAQRDEEELKISNDNTASAFSEDPFEGEATSQVSGKTLTRQVGGKGLIAQRGGKGIVLPDQGDASAGTPLDDVDAKNEDPSKNEENGVDESEEDLSQEEEDISQQEEDDIEEQEEEDTLSRQDEDEVKMDDLEQDNEERTEDNDPSEVNDEMNESEAETKEQEDLNAKRKASHSPKPELRAKQETKRKNRKRKGRGYRRLFSDSMKMFIPLNVTADLGVAIKRTRDNRIASFYEHFPELRPQELNDADNVDEAVDEDGDEQPKEVSKSRARKRQKLQHAPQPNQFASMIDYLEAKYVQGVMVADNEDEDDEEVGGSVYSETSFLDDTGLQRTVAEQVMGQATTTKLELEDDDAFFVNVGDLEVQESDMTKQNYDPLKEIQDEAKKKQKKPTKTTKETKNSAPEKGSAKKDSTSATVKTETAKTKKDKASAKPKAKTESARKTSKTEAKLKDYSVDMTSPSILRLKHAAERSKKARDDAYNELVREIKSWDTTILPKRDSKHSKVRVAVTVPENKKAGDWFSFANPHKPDQKLRAIIPKGVEPQGKFYVQIPGPENAPEASSSSADYNKIPRESYDNIDDYARAYDDWADAEGAYRKAIKDKDYSAHKQKRNKFDDLVLEFPQDLQTPVDKAYLQRIIRRARQNRHKRALREAMEDYQENGSNSEVSVDNRDQNWEKYAPKRGRLFPSVAFDGNDFSKS